MYWTINVSLNGVHCFATAKRSLTERSHAKSMFELLSNRFPANEGYKVVCHVHTEYSNDEKFN